MDIDDVQETQEQQTVQSESSNEPGEKLYTCIDIKPANITKTDTCIPKYIFRS